MAILVACDYHAEKDGFVAAMATVSVYAKDGNVVSSQKSQDTCMEHFKVAVYDTWALGLATPNFYEVRIHPLG